MANLFKNALKEGESLFLNSVALDFDYQPKLVPYRENHQKFIANCIKPLFQGRNGKNIFIFGPSGVGKTVSTRHVLNELEEYNEIIPIYINCWKKDTSFKIINEICEIVNYKWVHNKKTEELFKDVSKILNKKSVVFCFDECDKLKEFDLIYSIIDEIYKKCLIFITNERNWVDEIDARIKSRLVPENLEFEPYKLNEVEGILKQRMEFAFIKDSFDKETLQFIVKETLNKRDIRFGLTLMKNSVEIAEDEASRKVLLEHAKEARTKLNENNNELNKEEIEILKLIKDNPMKSVMELFKLYKENVEDISSRTFYRKISKLKDKSLIDIKESDGYGKINLIDNTKKLDEF